MQRSADREASVVLMCQVLPFKGRVAPDTYLAPRQTSLITMIVRMRDFSAAWD